MTTVAGIVKSARNIMRQDTGTASDELRILQLGWMLFLKIFSDKDKELELLVPNYVSPIPDELHWEQWAGDDEGITGDPLIRFVDQKLFPKLKSIDVSTGNKRALLVREVFENNYNYMKSGIHLRQVINKLNEIDFNNSKDKQVFGEIYETFLGELQSAGTLGEFYTPRAVTDLMTELVNPRHAEKVLDPACGTGGFLTAAIEHLKKSATTVAQREAIGKNVAGWEYKPLPYVLANTNLILHDVTTPNIRFGDSLEKPLTEYSKKDRVEVILANPPFGGVVSNNNENNFPQAYRTKESADLFLILMVHLLNHNGRAAIVLPDGSLSGEGVKERVRQKLLEDCNLHTIVRLPNSVFEPYASVATNLLFFTKGEKTSKIWYWEHKLPQDYKAYSKTKPIQSSEFEGLRRWWNNRRENEQAWLVDIKTIEENGWNLDVNNPYRAVVKRANPEDCYSVYNTSNAKIKSLITEVVNSTISNNSIVTKILDKDISLFKDINVVRQLRQAILHEAIQGRLTNGWRSLNKNIESAHELLERISSMPSNQARVKRGKKPSNGTTKEKIPFALPSSWAWCRIEQVGSVIRGKSPKYDKNSSKKILNQKCVRWFYVEMQHCKTVSLDWYNELSTDAKTKTNDILVNSTGEGTIGRSAIVDDSSSGLFFDSHVLRLRTAIEPHYIVSLINSDFGQSQINDLKGAKSTKQTELGVNNLSNMIIPLPPLLEQKEIVSQANKLLAICDQLEIQITQSRSHAEQLMQVVLKEAFSQPEGNTSIPSNVLELKPSSNDNDYYKRTLLAAEIVDQLHKEPTFGHLKFQKVFFLCQKMQNMDLPTNFLQQPAGPYDPELQRSVDAYLIENEWFTYNQNSRLKYQRLSKAGAHKKDFQKHFKNELAGIKNLIALFRTKQSNEVEAVATLYACWEVILNSGKPFTKPELIKKFYNWSEEKSKFSDRQLNQVISWMEKNHIFPVIRSSIKQDKRNAVID